MKYWGKVPRNVKQERKNVSIVSPSNLATENSSAGVSCMSGRRSRRLFGRHCPANCSRRIRAPAPTCHCMLCADAAIRRSRQTLGPSIEMIRLGLGRVWLRGRIGTRSVRQSGLRAPTAGATPRTTLSTAHGTAHGTTSVPRPRRLLQHRKTQLVYPCDRHQAGVLLSRPRIFPLALCQTL